MNAADNDDDAVINSDTNESTNESLDKDDCTKRHEISAFSRIVDVPGDGNCGFYAIMALYTTCFRNISARQNRINFFIMKLRTMIPVRGDVYALYGGVT